MHGKYFLAYDWGHVTMAMIGSMQAHTFPIVLRGWGIPGAPLLLTIL